MGPGHKAHQDLPQPDLLQPGGSSSLRSLLAPLNVQHEALCSETHHERSTPFPSLLLAGGCSDWEGTDLMTKRKFLKKNPATVTPCSVYFCHVPTWSPPPSSLWCTGDAQSQKAEGDQSSQATQRMWRDAAPKERCSSHRGTQQPPKEVGGSPSAGSRTKPHGATQKEKMLFKPQGTRRTKVASSIHTSPPQLPPWHFGKPRAHPRSPREQS